MALTEQRLGVSPTLPRAPHGGVNLERLKRSPRPRSLDEHYSRHKDFFQFNPDLSFTLNEAQEYGLELVPSLLAISGAQLTQPIDFSFRRHFEKNGDGRSHPFFTYTFNWGRPKTEKGVPSFHVLDIATYDLSWKESGEVFWSEAGSKIIKSFSLRDTHTEFLSSVLEDVPKLPPHQDLLSRHHSIHSLTSDASLEGQALLARELVELVK